MPLNAPPARATALSKDPCGYLSVPLKKHVLHPMAGAGTAGHFVAASDPVEDPETGYWRQVALFEKDLQAVVKACFVVRCHCPARAQCCLLTSVLAPVPVWAVTFVPEKSTVIMST